jgi:hypothetical protein
VRGDGHRDDVVLSRHSVSIVVALIRQIWRGDVDAGGSSATCVQRTVIWVTLVEANGANL